MIPRKLNEFKEQPHFLRDGKNVEYTAGNVLLDGSVFDTDTVIKAGTALYMDETSKKYKKVEEATPETMKGAVISANAIKVFKKEDTLVPAIRKASVIPERLTGVTENFKKATKGRITYDI